MMTPSVHKLLSKKNLSYKIIFAIMLAMSLLVSLMIIIFAYSNNVLEDKLLVNQNLAELERLKKEFNRNPDYELPQTAKLRFYLPLNEDDVLPEYLQSLPIGYNDEVNVESYSYFVSVGEMSGRPVYIVSDISEFERSERIFETIIVWSWAILIALIFSVSYLLSRYLLKPISDFADEIEQLKPQQRGLTLSGKYQGLEIEKMARSFDRFLNKMDEYVERQHSFAAMSSHELRTPLTVIQTSAELISSQSENELIQQQCQKISRSSGNMSNMILALLSITRDQPSIEKNSDSSLMTVIEDVLEQHEREIKMNGITVHKHIHKDEKVASSDSLLAVVVNNLLSNAIKHCTGGEINIAYEYPALLINDNGSGLDTQNIDQLFKLGVSGNKNGGYGLGLYITKLICDKQGWRLDLTSANPGTQAKVTFLPRAKNVN